MEVTLEQMEMFFDSDMKIKQILVYMAPNQEDAYNDTSDYIDRFLKGLNRIKFQFNKIFDNFNYDDEAQKVIDDKFIRYELKALKRVRTYEDIINLYKECCSDMSAKLVNRVKEEFIGYTLFQGSTSEVLKSATTINEMLHVIHSSIVNNEKNYQSMNKLDIKINDEGSPIVLYGRENEIGKQIFDNFSIEIAAGNTDIVSLKNKILIMVRDRGHALTIQVEINNNDFWITYFIPKICNLEMVKALKGINYIDKNSSYAMGSFKSTKENLSLELNNFIGAVPMDDDMVFLHSHGK